MEADDVAAEQRFEDLHAELKRLEDVRARERSMTREADVCVQQFPLQIVRRQQQVGVVHPDHVLFLLDLKKLLGVFSIHITIRVPQLVSNGVYVRIVRALEVVEQWAQELLMVQEEVLQFVALKPDRVTLFPDQQLGDLLAICLAVGDYARPANPAEVKVSLLANPEQRRVRHAFALLDGKATIILLHDADGQFEAHDDQ